MKELKNVISTYFEAARERNQESQYVKLFGRRKFFFPAVRLYVITLVPRIVSYLIYEYQSNKPIGLRGSRHTADSFKVLFGFLNHIALILVIATFILGLINQDDKEGVRMKGLGLQVLKSVRRTIVGISALVLKFIMFFVDLIKFILGSDFTKSVKRKANLED